MTSERRRSSSMYPETYYFAPTPHVPNSILPALIYRQVLPFEDAVTAEHPQVVGEKARHFLEKNHWLQGGDFKTFTAHHYHSVTHECYAVYKGSSRLLLGKGPLDIDVEGVEVDIEAGDIIILPAGVAHCSLDSQGDYSYLGLYPEGSPHWDNNFCKDGIQETRRKSQVAHEVPVPNYDPVFGLDGPLTEIWRRASASVPDWPVMVGDK